MKSLWNINKLTEPPAVTLVRDNNAKRILNLNVIKSGSEIHMEIFE